MVSPAFTPRRCTPVATGTVRSLTLEHTTSGGVKARLVAEALTPMTGDARSLMDYDDYFEDPLPSPSPVVYTADNWVPQSFYDKIFSGEFYYDMKSEHGLAFAHGAWVASTIGIGMPDDWCPITISGYW